MRDNLKDLRIEYIETEPEGEEQTQFDQINDLFDDLIIEIEF